MLAGARIIKTGIAITLSMLICNYFDIQPAIFAGAATVLNMQPSLGLSFHNAWEQILVHFVSISIAIILGLTLGNNPFIMGLTSVLVILICQHFRWRGSLAGGVMASIFILSSPSAQFIDHALIRSLAIFVGVSVALIVNFTIAPPRYRQPLQKKLLELNSLVTKYFDDAVQSFLSLDIPSPALMEEQKNNVEQLFREVQKLYKLYYLDIGAHTFDPNSEQEKISKYYEEYLAYNKGLWQRTRDILFLSQERRERRQQAGDRPISSEFQEILDLLSEAQTHFLSQNEELKNKLEGQNIQHVEEPHIWRKLDKILNNWHNQFPSGSYSLHALIEISLITYKIRWAAKEAMQLLDNDLIL
jgi:uncharacterized membrane protein YgaE (UPF0421/DUF939 family)